MSNRAYVKNSHGRMVHASQVKAQESRIVAARESRKPKGQLAELKKEVMRQAMREAGFVDLALIDNLNNVDSLNMLAIVSIGPSVNQRVGANIKWKSIQVRGLLSNGTIGGFNTVAVIVVYDREATDALPKPSDILMSASPVALLNDQNRQRFLIVKRWDYILSGVRGDPANSGYPAGVFVDEYVKLKGLFAKYVGTETAAVGGKPATGTGTIGDIKKGALYVLTLGNNSVTDATGPGTALNIRVRFADVQG